MSDYGDQATTDFYDKRHAHVKRLALAKSVGDNLQLHSLERPL
jgi:hypothetical protein